MITVLTNGRLLDCIGDISDAFDLEGELNSDVKSLEFIKVKKCVSGD